MRSMAVTGRVASVRVVISPTSSFLRVLPDISMVTRMVGIIQMYLPTRGRGSRAIWNLPAVIWPYVNT